MTHTIRRTFVATLAGAVLAAAALLSLSAAPASAERGHCGSGDFCLSYAKGESKGVYHFGGNDPNLRNDRYENDPSDVQVARSSLFAQNRGTPDPRADVIIYANPRYRGESDCIRRGDRGALPFRWWFKIESYRWVTPSECRRAGVIDLK